MAKARALTKPDFFIFDAPWRQKSKTIPFLDVFAYNLFVFQPILFKLKTKIGMAKYRALISRFFIFTVGGAVKIDKLPIFLTFLLVTCLFFNRSS